MLVSGKFVKDFLLIDLINAIILHKQKFNPEKIKPGSTRLRLCERKERKCSVYISLNRIHVTE